MKHLILILVLSTGEQTRDLMPAYECYGQASFIERAWANGAEMRRDVDNAILTDVACVAPMLAEWIAPSSGDCEVGT